MPSGFRSPVRRLLSAFLLGAFLAIAPGISVLELGWHLVRADDTHAKAPHFEAAGGAHADHCQLGLAHADGRLPATAPARVPPAAETRQGPAALVRSLPGAGLPPVALPRAPPTHG
jgi:hypothetical protein